MPLPSFRIFFRAQQQDRQSSTDKTVSSELDEIYSNQPVPPSALLGSRWVRGHATASQVVRRILAENSGGARGHQPDRSTGRS